MPEDQITALRDSVPKPVDTWYSITNEATADGAPARAKINIYDAIGGWFGTNAADFVTELDALDVDELEVHVNSPGGAVWDGIAIMNALKAHRARVTVIVDGIAASAASIVAMGGDEVVMAEGSQMMIHRASGGAWGNAAFLRDTAAILDKIDGNLAGIYARRAGGTRESWLELMTAETWYDAAEAVEAGLADRADESLEGVDAEASFDLSIFNYAGRSHAPAPRRPVAPLRPVAMAPGAHEPIAASPATYRHERGIATDAAPKTPVSSEPGNTNRKESPMSDALKAGLRDRLGITDAEASEEVILTALDEALEEQANPVEPQAAQLPDGVTTIETSVLSELQSAATEVRAIREEQAASRRSSLVEAAISDGRIPPARRDHWLAALKADEEGMAPVLAGLAKGTIPVEEIGHSDDVMDADDALYAKFYDTPKEA